MPFRAGEEMRTEISAKFRRERVEAELRAGRARAGRVVDRPTGSFALSLSADPLTCSGCQGFSQSVAGHPSTAASSSKAVAPSIASRTMSACPAWRAVSSIRCRSTQRSDQASTSAGFHGAGGTGHGVVEGQTGDDLAGLGRHLVEEGEHVGQRLVLAQPEAVLVGVLGVAVVAVTLEDGVQPAPLGVGDVLDQAADARARYGWAWPAPARR